MSSQVLIQNPKLKIQNLLQAATHRLAAAGCDSPRLDAEVLLAHSLGQERTWLFLHGAEPLIESQLDSFEQLLRRREQREPVAYLVGYKAFFGLEFEVNPHVLVPRPETELLVESAVQLLDRQFGRGLSGLAEKPKIVDVGTGSGCIAVSLARHWVEASLLAVDISPAALELARRNAERHQLADRITFLAGNLLEPVTEPVDLIVSNPPYVSQTELASAMPEVGRYEPRLALAGGEDGLDTVRQLLAQAREKLKPGGGLLVEIGSNQAQAVLQLARDNFPMAQVDLKKDLAGLDRLLVIENVL